MELTATKEIIVQLKAVRKEKNLSVPRIKAMVEENGDFLSLSTLHRVFADGSEENDSFSYDRTLAPIARVLLYKGDGDSDAVKNDRIEGLRAVISLKNEEVERLHDMIEHLENRISFLLEQIEKKDRRMDEKDQIIKRLMDKCL